MLLFKKSFNILTPLILLLPSCMQNAKQSTGRLSEYPVHELILNRWSPRAMSGETITDNQLKTLFEAARWAPSAYNIQPWRFIYAKRDTPQWDTFFNLLVPFNQAWTKNAAVLVVIISHNGVDKPSKTHSFDAGAAWENVALQGSSMNLVVHGISGFDYNKAKTELNIPDDYTVEAMFVIGKPGKLETLPSDLQEREKPSGRKTLENIIFEGSFKNCEKS